MSSLQRKIDGPALVQHLTKADQLIDEAIVAKHGRSARTLSKEGPLRLTLIALAAGGFLPSHSTEGPVTIHVLDGSVTFSVQEQEYRLVSGDVLILGAGVQHSAKSDQLIDEAILAKHGRSARTLSKEGPLRLTLIALAPGGFLPSHSTEGPVTIHVLDGSVTFSVQEQEYRLVSGDVLILGAGVQHSAKSDEGARFLLTVVHPSAGTQPSESRA